MKTHPVIQLIESMSKNEKGFFVKNCSKPNSINLILFNIINSTKTGKDPLNIQRKFTKKLPNVNYPNSRNKLHQAITQSLVQYHANDHTVNQLLLEFEVLFNKGQYKSCMNTLNKAIKIAETHFSYLDILRIIDCYKQVQNRIQDIDTTILKWYKVESTIFKKHQISSTYFSFLNDIKFLFSTNRSLTDDNIKLIRSVQSHKYLRSEHYIIDSKCRYMHYLTLFMCSFMQNDLELMTSTASEIKRLLTTQEDLSYFSDFEKLNILGALARQESLQINIKSSEHYVNLMTDILLETKEIPLKTKLGFQVFIYAIQTDFLLRSQELDKATDKISEISDFIDQYPQVKKEKNYPLLLGNSIVLEFMRKSYRSSLKKLFMLLTFDGETSRKEIMISAKLTEVALFYILEEYDLFESRLKGFIKLIKDNVGVENKIWSLYANFFSQLWRTGNFEKTSDTLLNGLNQYQHNHINQDLVHLKKWVESKKTNAFS